MDAQLSARRRVYTIVAPAVSLCVVAMLGLSSLQYPFVADQVVPLYAAKTIAAGGTLYIDFWDNKLPGLVWFYLAGGTLFGFEETGIHTLELLWLLGFSVVLICATRQPVREPWIAVFTPIAVVGTYYAATDAFHHTQLEFVTAPFILIGLWLASVIGTNGRHRTFRYFGFGVCGGTTLIFKVVFGPLFAALLLFSLFFAWRRHQLGPREIGATMLLPACCGGVLVPGVVAGIFWYQGALEALYWTAFVYPPAALESSPPAPLLRLVDSALFFLGAFAVWLPFVVLAIVDLVKRDLDLFVALVVVWLFAGLVLILIQTFSWWPYHFLMLFTPFGILGIRGCSVLPLYAGQQAAERPSPDSRYLLVILLCASATLVFPANQKLSAHIEVFNRRQGDGDAFRRFVNIGYRQVDQSTRFLSSESARPGPIYVFGDPLYYYLSGREPALPIIGWPWEFFLQEQWERIPAQLSAAKPPYIYIDKDYRRMMETRGGGVLDYIVENYARFTTDAKGVWYQIVVR